MPPRKPGKREPQKVGKTRLRGPAKAAPRSKCSKCGGLDGQHKLTCKNLGK